MYNPYNWDINPIEDRYEKWTQTLNEISKLSAEKSVAMLGVQLAIIDLKDSIQYELDNNKLCPNTEHDIEHYFKKVEEYKNIDEKIKQKRKVLDNIY